MRLFVFILTVLFIAGCGSSKEVSDVQVSEEVPQESSEKEKLVILSTSYGDVKIKLYDETPLHKKNFLSLVEDGYFEDLLFHRVIENFMIQGGDPNSRGALPGVRLGTGGPDYTIPAEFDARFCHKKGALAAARTGGSGNPEKRSSGSQFYIVQGTVQTEDKLANIESRTAQNHEGFAYTEEQKETYKSMGGTPFLDMEYTVFGEVVEGLNIVDSIAAVKTGAGDRPEVDVKMNMKVVQE